MSTGVTATKKFSWDMGDHTKSYFPGDAIDVEEAAAWAIDHKHGTIPEDQVESRALRGAPENKARSLEGEGGENKGEGGEAEVFNPLERRKSPEQIEAMRESRKDQEKSERKDQKDAGDRKRVKRGAVVDELELKTKA